MIKNVVDFVWPSYNYYRKFMGISNNNPLIFVYYFFIKGTDRWDRQIVPPLMRS